MEIFQYDFMVRAFIAGLIIALLAPSIGIFLVLRRYSLLADTLSHVSLVGVATGVLAGVSPLWGALAVSVASAFVMEKIRLKKTVFGESILAVFLSGSLALALIILSLAHGLNVNIFSFLFGSITTVSRTDLLLVAGFGFIVLVLIKIFFRPLFFVAYEEELAKASGIKVERLNLLTMVLAAVTVSLSMRIVGTLLIGALMVIPVISASQFALSFFRTWALSVIISLFCVGLGLFASFYLNLPSGAAIVAASLAVFAFSLFANKSSSQ